MNSQHDLVAKAESGACEKAKDNIANPTVPIEREASHGEGGSEAAQTRIDQMADRYQRMLAVSIVAAEAACIAAETSRIDPFFATISDTEQVAVIFVAVVALLVMGVQYDVSVAGGDGKTKPAGGVGLGSDCATPGKIDVRIGYGATIGGGYWSVSNESDDPVTVTHFQVFDYWGGVDLLAAFDISGRLPIDRKITAGTAAAFSSGIVIHKDVLVLICHVDGSGRRVTTWWRFDLVGCPASHVKKESGEILKE